MKCPACNKKLSSFDRERGLKFHFVCDLDDPNACKKCGEPLTRVTTGSTKCRCQAPRIPQHLRNNASDDRPSPAVRYGN